jgi:hypothetical protein
MPTKIDRYIKFTGDFKDLIPNGWTFQKLFARNYRQYHKTCDGSQWGSGCRIWQHLGGYLEIDDLFDWSALIVEQIQANRLEEWAYSSKVFADVYAQLKADIKAGVDWSKVRRETVYWLYLDMEQDRFVSRQSAEGKDICRFRHDDSQLEEARKAHYDRYREYNLDPAMILMIQDLLQRGWIKVVPDNRPR